MLFTIIVIFLNESGPIQWKFSQHLKHQAISIHNADYAPMRFPVFKG